MVDVVQGPPRPPGPPAPRRSWARRPRGLTVALVAVVVAGLAAIGVLVAISDDEPTSTAPLATGTSAPALTTPSTIDPQAAVKAEILAAYRQAFDAFIAVASEPNGQPTDPRLEEHTIGNALLASQASIDRLRKAGQVVRGTIEVHPVVVELTTDTAVVEDCGIDRLGVLNAATGEVVTPIDDPPKAGSARATYRLINGVWMQDGFKDLKQACVPPAS